MPAAVSAMSVVSNGSDGRWYTCIASPALGRRLVVFAQCGTTPFHSPMRTLYPEAPLGARYSTTRPSGDWWAMRPSRVWCAVHPAGSGGTPVPGHVQYSGAARAGCGLPRRVGAIEMPSRAAAAGSSAPISSISVGMTSQNANGTSLTAGATAAGHRTMVGER